MSNSFRGQTQFMQSPMGFGGMNYGDPFVSRGGMGGYGTTFGGYGMGGGYGQPQQSLVPQYQPTINDLFSQYFSQQYYGGPAFDPFAATSLFGGGFGGGFGGRRGGGMGGRMRRRRQMFEDMFGPQQQPTAQPEPMVQPAVQPYSEPVAATGTYMQSSAPSLAAWANMPPHQQREYLASGGVAPVAPPEPQQYFSGLPIDFGYSMPVASAQPAPYMPTYQPPPMSREDMMLAREAIRSGAFSAL